MKIRFLRNVAVQGEHREAGSVLDVDNPTAFELIAIRAAAPVTEVETAEAPMQARENAAIKKAKKAPKR